MRTLLLLLLATPAAAQPCFLALPVWDAYSLEEKASSVELFLAADSLAFDLKQAGQIFHLLYITHEDPALRQEVEEQVRVRWAVGVRLCIEGYDEVGQWFHLVDPRLRFPSYNQQIFSP